MERILFVDACMRGAEVSRTYALCQHFLQRYTARRPEAEVVRRDLAGAELPVLTGALADEREGLTAQSLEHPLLAPAREVAGADLILVGAPFWDWTFPAALKVYLEWASTLGITFGYTQEGEQVGLSRARHLVYITTAGGPIEEDFGYSYVKYWAARMGITSTRYAAAQGLDIRGADVQGILERAKGELERLADQL